jgi:hypothetical protein
VLRGTYDNHTIILVRANRLGKGDPMTRIRTGKRRPTGISNFPIELPSGEPCGGLTYSEDKDEWAAQICYPEYRHRGVSTFSAVRMANDGLMRLSHVISIERVPV